MSVFQQHVFKTAGGRKKAPGKLQNHYVAVHSGTEFVCLLMFCDSLEITSQGCFLTILVFKCNHLGFVPVQNESLKNRIFLTYIVTPIAINGVICVLFTCDIKDQYRIELGFQVCRESLGNREIFSVAQLCRQGGSSRGLERASFIKKQI